MLGHYHLKNHLTTGPSHTPILPSPSSLYCAQLLEKDSLELHLESVISHNSQNKLLVWSLCSSVTLTWWTQLLSNLRAQLSPSLYSGSRDKITKLFNLVISWDSISNLIHRAQYSPHHSALLLGTTDSTIPNMLPRNLGADLHPHLSFSPFSRLGGKRLFQPMPYNIQ